CCAGDCGITGCWANATVLRITGLRITGKRSARSRAAVNENRALINRHLGRTRNNTRRDSDGSGGRDGPDRSRRAGVQACAWEQPFSLKFAGIGTANRAGQWPVCGGDEETSSFELRLMEAESLP